MTLIATVPFASVAEADAYFDPLNHMYADEWWAAATGSKAKVSIPGGDLQFEVNAAGVAGNLYHTYLLQTGYPSSVSLEADPFGPVVQIIAHTEDNPTDEDFLALALANSDITEVLTPSLATGHTVPNHMPDEVPTIYFSGGIDPNPDRLGEKAPALAFATRKINNLPFAGEKAVLAQANAFPRKYLRADAYVGLMPTADAYYTQTEVPDDVKMACCEEALAIMKYGNTPRYKLQTENVKSFAFGSQGLRETYTGRTKEGNIISGEAMNLLRKYMRRNYLMVA